MGEITIKVLAAAIVAIAVAAPACAQERGTYMGFGLGQSRIHADTASIDAGVRRSGFATSSTSVDEHDGAWKIYLGYRFNRNFALEGAHTDFGRFSLHTVTTGPSANVGGSMRANAWGLDAVALVPVSRRFTLSGKLGLQRWDVRDEVAAVNARAASSATVGARGNDHKLGLGVRYDISRDFGVRFEWERFVNMGDAATTGRGDIDLLEIGLQYRF